MKKILLFFPYLHSHRCAVVAGKRLFVVDADTNGRCNLNMPRTSSRITLPARMVRLFPAGAHG